MTVERQISDIPTNQLSTKRGFPVYRTNPSVPQTNGLPTRTKRINVPGGRGSVIVDNTTGELKGIGGLGFWWEEVRSRLRRIVVRRADFAARRHGRGAVEGTKGSTNCRSFPSAFRTERGVFWSLKTAEIFSRAAVRRLWRVVCMRWVKNLRDLSDLCFQLRTASFGAFWGDGRATGR